MSSAILTDGEDVLIRVKAVPGASRDQIAGVLGDRIKVRVSAPPEGGKANTAIVRLLAKMVGVKPAKVEIESGHGAPEKLVRIRATDEAAVRASLAS